MAPSATSPVLRLNFLSHGTLLLQYIEPSRRFYEEFLGLDVVQTSPHSLAVRLNSDTSVACVARGERFRRGVRDDMEQYCFGLTVDGPEAVVEANRLAHQYKDEYGMRAIGDLHETDGTLRFTIEDLDGNYWEILDKAPGAPGQAMQ